MSISSSGVLSDGGGHDSVSFSADVRNDRTSEDASPTEFWPRINAWAQGAGTGGPAGAAEFGAVLMGEGDTSYSIDVSAAGKAYAWVAGQAASESRGLAAIDDRGGEDTYAVSVRQALQREITVDDSCTRSGKPCAKAEAIVFAPGSARVYSQGAGSLESVGQLLDHGGDDVYRTTVEHVAEVVLHDQLRAPSGPPRLAVAGFGSVTVLAQAAGLSSSGILIDDSGTDSYTLDVDNTVTARATSDNATGAPVVTARILGLFVDGQGATGIGTLLLDRGGVGDRVVSHANVSTKTVPAGGAFIQWMTWPVVQGAGANARFILLGSNPSVESSPARPACPAPMETQGYRGYQTWVDCPLVPREVDEGNPEYEPYDSSFPNRASMGYVPNSSAASRPSLTMTADTPTSARVDSNEDPTPTAVKIPVGARLLDPSGAPLAGETIHFVLHFLDYDYWQIHQQIDAVTDEDGVARAMLPALNTYLQPAGPWKIGAIYDGKPGVLYPRHIASPLTLTE